MALIGYLNVIDDQAATLTPSAAVDTFPVDNLRIPQGPPSIAWQTPADTTSANLTITAPSAISWRVACLARTNLSTSSTMRVRVGNAESFAEDAPIYLSAPDAIGWALPAGGTTNRTHTPGTARATAFDATGTLIEYGGGAARIQHNPSTLERLGWLLEPLRVQQIQNPRFEGASAGSPGTLPTGMSVSIGPSGISQQVVGTGTESGIPYLDLRFSGTAGSTGSVLLTLQRATGLAASQTYAHSAFLRLIAGTLPAVTHSPAYYTSAPAFISSVNSAALTITTAELRKQRSEFVATTPATTTIVDARLDFALSSGVAYDFTIRIGAPQMELGQFATMPILPPVGTPQATTRGQEASVLPMPANDGNLTFFCETMTQAISSASSEAFLARMRLSGDNNNAIRLRSNAGASPNTNVVAVIGGVSVRVLAQSPTILGPVRRDVIRLTPASLSHWANGAQIDALAGLTIVPAQLNIVSGEAITIIRDLRFYRALTDGQALALSNNGSTISAPLYDSGTVPTGVAWGIGQALHIMPAATSGTTMSIDIADGANPDRFLNIPLCYAGPAVDMPISMGTDYGLEAKREDVETRGGHVFISALAKRRGWELKCDAIRDADISWLDPLEASSAQGSNILVIPRTTSARASSETVFGLLKPGRRGFIARNGNLRSWSASILERL